MITLEFTGKNVQKAIEEGLAKLNKTLEEVDIKVISPGGLFRKAKVAITINTENSQINDKENIQVKSEEATQQINSSQENKKETIEATALENNEESNEISKKQFKPVKTEKISKKEAKSTEKSKSNQEALNKQTIVKQENNNKKVEDITINKVSAHKENDERQERPKANVNDEIANKATTFLENLLNMMNVDFALSSNIKDGELYLSIECESGAVIGYRGETLDALEYLTSLVINKSDDKYYRINIDCNDYRSKRIETLTALAKRMAEKATKTGRRVVLEPMSSSSRKIIHSVLNDNERIITKSEGREPNRRIVIIPKRFK